MQNMISKDNSSNAMSVINPLIEKIISADSVNVDALEKILNMQERIMNKNAEVAYNNAMAACQAEMPLIVADKQNQQTRSNYASLGNIVNNCKPVLTKHGFALSFYTERSDKDHYLIICCDVTHSEGHKETRKHELPLDMAGIAGKVNKTGIHAHASTNSYGVRYLFCDIFNIAIANNDDDAVQSGGVTIGKLMEHNGWVRHLYQKIWEIKYGIECNTVQSMASAKEVFASLSTDEKSGIWLAPSKGGIFTTHEISVIKNGFQVKGE